MWFIYLLVYITVASVVYYYIERKKQIPIESLEDKIGLSTIVMLWPLFLLIIMPWAMSHGITFIEKAMGGKDGN